MHPRRQILAALAALAALPLARVATAEAKYPVRSVRLVVPFAAGGGNDIVARLIAVQAAKSLGEPMVVDNKGGAGGSLGSDLVAKSAPDGYTILMATVSTHAINPALYPKLPYDPIRSFEPISLVARAGGVVAVNGNSPVKSLRELAAAIRKEPEKYSFGSQGVGGVGHLTGEMFNSQSGAKAAHIPYKGAAPALQDLIAGNIQVIYDTLPALLPHVQSGALRALAVTTPKRLASVPQIATTAEAGFPEFLAETWNAVLAPAGTPPEVVHRLNRAIVLAVRGPTVSARMNELSAQPVGSTPAELAEFMRAEVRRWAPVVKASGAKAE